MKKILWLLLLVSFFGHADSFAQNVKTMDSPNGKVISDIGGSDIPNSGSILDIRSVTRGVLLPRMSTGNRDAIASPPTGLLIYNSNSNQFNYYDGSLWQQTSIGNQWSVNGTKYYYNGGNVGIGTSDPLHKLDVSGVINSNSNVLVGGFLGIGTNSPNYKLHIQDGSFNMYNSLDVKSWRFSYDTGLNRLGLFEDGTARVSFNNGGNIGIGTSSPAYRLDVSGGSIHTTNNLVVDGNATIDGNLTVRDGKGIMSNSQGTGQLKYYTREFSVTAVLAGHAQSGEFSIGLSAGVFSSAPAVFVGDITSTGGTVGELYRVIVMVYGCTTSSCKARLVNTSPNPVNYDITYNLIAVGP